MDLPIFEMNGVAISSMTDKELLTAIKQNEGDRNYPDSATTILLAEAIKRIMTADIKFKDDAAAARQRVINETLAIGDDDDGGDE